MFLLNIWSDYKNLVKKFQVFLKIKSICKLNFHEVENSQEVKCTPPPLIPVNVLLPLMANTSQLPPITLSLRVYVLYG